MWKVKLTESLGKSGDQNKSAMVAEDFILDFVKIGGVVGPSVMNESYVDWSELLWPIVWSGKWVGGGAIDEVVAKSLVYKRLADAKDFTYLLDWEAQLKLKNRYATF